MQRRIIERLEQEREEEKNKAQKKQKASKTKKTKEKAGKPQPRSREKVSAQNATGIKKRYLKTRKVCKVTFVLPRIVAGDAKRACIVGDFNDWNDTANPMKKTKTKGFTITLELEPEREYQFRYLVDGSKWENDRTADKYVKSPFGDSENSVVSI
jgi:1,4-alpha-glucan branching enzyme